MKWKKEQVILLVIIIVLGAYLLVRRTGRTHYTLPDPGVLAKNKITKLEVRKKDSLITLERKDGAWVIAPQGYPADTGKTDAMLSDVADITLSALAGEPGNDAVYDLDADHRIEVRVYAGDALRRTVEIGKLAPSGRHTFVRLDRFKGVYHARNDLRSVFDTTVARLRDKTVLSIPGKVRSIVLNRRGRKLTILSAAQKTAPGAKGGPSGTAKDGAEIRWKTSAGKPVNGEEVEDLVGMLQNLACDDFIGGKDKKEFRSPAYTVALNAGKTYRLSLFRESGHAYAAVSSESDYPFLLSEWRAQKIMKDVDGLAGSK